MIPLFEHFPLLRAKLPHIALGEFPTPVEKLERLGKHIGSEHLYIKRDDLSGTVYGGNKVRKLEFLLGHALHVKAKEVLTFGFAGSNHAMATAIYAHQVGLKSISLLMPQPNTYYLRRNLLMSYYCGAELHQHRNVPVVALGTMYQLLRHKLKYGSFPTVIAAGGSSPPGVLGFVNAAFELQKQIISGQLPEPDRIYVALGTTGTAVGLLLGLKAANLKSQVIPIRVADEQFANARKMVKLFRETTSFLCSLDPAFPHVELSEQEVAIRHDFFGRQYALFTKEGMDAVYRMQQTEGITLDGTYTGKALAALIHDVETQAVKDEVLLFWNTYNSRDLSKHLAAVDYRQLPRCFHRYFEEEVQPLDSEF
jgi:D-cysteine desulfhydrase